MRSPKSAFDVQTSVNGSPTVLVVDATNDLKKFEYKTTQEVCAELKKRGVVLTGNSPVFAKDVATFAAAFSEAGDFTTVLLFSHGSRVADGADVLRLGDLRSHWYLANGVDMKLDDKAVLLCVCEGACEDATYVLLREQLALMLVAPADKLSPTEALAFFPAVLEEVKTDQELTPERLRAAVRNHAQLANNKMVVFSAVGFVE